MKIAVIAWRAWSAARRYRSLMLNAVKEGHDVVGFAGNATGDMELGLMAFEDLGIEAYPQDEFWNVIDSFEPDVVFGEHAHQTYNEYRLEKWGQDYVNDRGKVGFLLDHHLYASLNPAPLMPPEASAPNTHFITYTKWQADAVSERGWWPDERTHHFGVPDLDFVSEEVDVEAVRQSLRVGDVLIGLFSNIPHEGLGKKAITEHIEEITSFLRVAKSEGWRVAIHGHPQHRKGRGVLVKYLRDRLPQIQEEGAVFVAGFAPGDYQGVHYRRCQGWELIASADCLITGTPDIIHEAYAMGKRCHLMDNLAWTIPRRPAESPVVMRDGVWVLDMEFERRFSMAGKVKKALSLGSNDIERDPLVVEKFLHNVDGIWWKRALELAERLSQG